jgi:hypothetical protein
MSAEVTDNAAEKSSNTQQCGECSPTATTTSSPKPATAPAAAGTPKKKVIPPAPDTRTKPGIIPRDPEEEVAPLHPLRGILTAIVTILILVFVAVTGELSVRSLFLSPSVSVVVGSETAPGR